MLLPAPPSLRGAPPPFSRLLLPQQLLLTSLVLRRLVLRLLLAGGAAAGMRVLGVGVVGVVEVGVEVAEVVAVAVVGVVKVAVVEEVARLVPAVGVAEGPRVAVEVELEGVEARERRLVVRLMEADVLDPRQQETHSSFLSGLPSEALPMAVVAASMSEALVPALLSIEAASVGAYGTTSTGVDPLEALLTFTL
ncbi:unnamed protein product [Closterium sp. Yama58-4]|nr:unnamed protein product [Closterium sp. Yama58-4]CAI5475932.1 unnamed protein product [Closterium sp. Yama58-4]